VERQPAFIEIDGKLHCRRDLVEPVVFELIDDSCEPEILRSQLGRFEVAFIQSRRPATDRCNGAAA
jgi:hypothetical protein